MSTVIKDESGSNQVNAGVCGMTGVILAGGKSSRYGRNKALEKLNGISLIERIIRFIQPLFENLIIITNTPQDYAYLHLPMFEDLIKGLGPLGGIYTGLEAISHESGFFVACDMPFLNIDLIRHMIKIRGDYDAVVPRIDWKMESLHAIYNRRCLTAIRELIAEREYQVIKFFQRINVRFVNEMEIRYFDPQLRSFFNVNRPEELMKAERLGDLKPLA